LNHSVVDYPGVYRELAHQLEDCPELGITNLQAVQGSLAVLSHTNCEVEMISDELSELEIPHKVKPRSGENGISAWIGAALRTLDQGTVSQNSIISRVSSLENTGTLTPPDPEEAYMTLRRLCVSNQVEIRTIHQRIHDFNITDDLVDDVYEGLVISTVHRAKGLEFDHVLFVPPRTLDEEPSLDFAEMARLLYVGMTRHREDIFRTKRDALDLRYWSTRGGISDGRWLKRAYRGRMTANLWRESLTGFEIRGDDADADRPAPADPNKNLTESEIQDFLLQGLAIGDALELELDTSRAEDNQYVTYLIKHCETGTTVGRTSRKFARDLMVPLSRFARILGKDINWPERLTGIRVHSVDTVAGPADWALSRGWVGTSRLWNRVRMHGLAQIMRSYN
jgi:DNA helicase-2/ATP-dependent DNA helicase PcrA